MKHDFHMLFSAYWWLIFPLFWMVSESMQLWSRHLKAQRAMDVIKACVEQGKEPPAEILQILQSSERKRRERHEQGYGWISVFLFAAIAAGLVMFAFLPGERDLQETAAFLFAAFVMIGLSVGNALVMFNRQRHEQDRNLPH
ncbi:MAG TPA: hypothetical protein VJ750_08975 [Rhizomicrobium sp.]|nr:hypothetical protein [Rhizomicrobium sp.]